MRCHCWPSSGAFWFLAATSCALTANRGLRVPGLEAVGPRVGGAGVDVKARRVKDAMSSFLIRRDDGINDGIAGQVFDSYEAAYAVVERYYADICCSDDREYYRIEPVDAPGEPALDANRA